LDGRLPQWVKTGLTVKGGMSALSNSGHLRTARATGIAALRRRPRSLLLRADTLLADLKRDFASVKHVKPAASRPDSAELYVLATGFRGAGSTEQGFG
jgi:FtsJ-like methyltransferase